MKTYTINQGNHSANGINLKFHCGLNVLKFKAVFEESCLYHLGDIDDNDINKLFGLTWGLTNDKNSFRIGWNCRRNNGKIQLYWYLHENGITKPTANDDAEHALLFEVDPGEVFEFYIEFWKTASRIVLVSPGHFSITIPFDFSAVPNCGYYNYPYFGGNKVAPQTMKIGIEN